MEIERRERDPDTGEMAPSEASLVGEGFSDVFAKIAAKLTGKTAKKLATKAAEKLVQKGAEKVGEKTGQLVGEKIYERFSTKPAEGRSAATEGERSERAEGPSEASRPPETKGKEIGEMLKTVSSPPAEASRRPQRPESFAPEKNKFQKINNVYADLL